MLMAYLPKEKIAIEADLFDSPLPGVPAPAATAANRTFYNHVERLNMQVDTIAPIHGKATPWGDFVKIVNAGK
jgi:hypothetical protein